MCARPERRAGGQTARGGGGLDGGRTARGGGGETERGGGETARGGGLTARDKLQQRKNALLAQGGLRAAVTASSGASTSRERPPSLRSLAANRKARSSEDAYAYASRSRTLPPLPETRMQAARESQGAGLPVCADSISANPAVGLPAPGTEAMATLQGGGAIPSTLEGFDVQMQHSFETWPERGSRSSEGEENEVYLPRSQPGAVSKQRESAAQFL